MRKQSIPLNLRMRGFVSTLYSLLVTSHWIEPFYHSITLIIPILETMEDWDQDKLEEVVKKKHGEAEKKKPKTEIVS